jgi:hypothetical protein
MNILNCIEPIFDKYGHFYVKHNEYIYEFSINSKNQLELFEIFNNENFQFEIIDDKNENKNLNLLSKCNTLKGKIIKEYIKEKQDNPDEEYESDEELDSNTIQNINTKMQYNPEDLEYLEDDDGENNCSDDEYFDISKREIYDSLHIVKYGNIKLRVLEEIDNTEVNEINGFYNTSTINHDFSGYDTYIYNGNEDENELAFISKISLFASPNRIFAYKDGSITLKILGSSKKRYNLEINKENAKIFLVEKEN